MALDAGSPGPVGVSLLHALHAAQVRGRVHTVHMPGHRRRPRALPALAGTVLVLLLTACATSAAEEQDGTQPSPQAAAPIAGTFDFGEGREMYLECAGTGSPRVLIIPGQRATVQEWQSVGHDQSAPPVFEQVAAQTRVCSYDRPGTPHDGTATSRSSPAPMPTNAEVMARDLRALLEAAGETGPTVLVAHSLGGLPGLLYTADHSDEVLGLILVDALTPELRRAETRAQWEVQKLLLTGDVAAMTAEYPDIEYADVDASMDQVEARYGDLPGIPYIVLTADDEWGPIVERMVAEGAVPPIVPPGFGYLLDEAQRVSRPVTAALIPGGVWISETDSGHIMHHDQPQLVADTILGMVDELRAAG
ncbi:alpha/beta hydrolase [Microbacterium caowuchunii]|nr:alpha/beta hydrolase [Microbacterium caowuchunii]